MSNLGPQTEKSSIVQGPKWPLGEKIRRELLGRCHQSEVLLVIDELIEHVRTMGIASRFRQDCYTRQMIATDESNPPMELIDVKYGKGKKLSEKGHKRTILLIELQRIKSEFIALFENLALLREEIEATNMESDGSHVPKPSAEERKKQDTFSR